MPFPVQIQILPLKRVCQWVKTTVSLKLTIGINWAVGFEYEHKYPTLTIFFGWWKVDFFVKRRPN